MKASCRPARRWQHWLLLVVLGIGLTIVLLDGRPGPVAYAEGVVSLVGRVADPQGEPVHGAEVHLLLNGQGEEKEGEHAFFTIQSQADGAFVIDLPAEEVGQIESLTVGLSRPHFEPVSWKASSEQIILLNSGESLRLPDLEMEHRITVGFWVASATFAFILVLIALEKLHHTMAALLDNVTTMLLMTRSASRLRWHWGSTHFPCCFPRCLLPTSGGSALSSARPLTS